MTAPKRIQRKRTKGWRMPEGAVYVGRPTVWGNPFPVDGPEILGLDLSLKLYGDIVRGCWNPTRLRHLGDQPYVRLYEAQAAWHKRIYGHPLEVARAELSGRDLACWCPLDQPCHADVLLQVVNSGRAS